MAAQNLPEAFDAGREIGPDGAAARRRTLAAFAGLALLGPLGELVRADAPLALGALMLFAGGGNLDLVIQDVAPGVPLRHSWLPALGAVAGFALGLAGHVAVGG